MWGKLDDKFWSHPKVNELSSEAGFLLTRLWSWIGAHETDGHIPVSALRVVWHSPTSLGELVDRGFLHERDGLTCDCGEHIPADKVGGYVAHDWLDCNPSRNERSIHTTKANERKSSELRRLIFDRDKGLCRYCAAQTNRADRVSDRAFQMDHVNPTMAIGAAGVVTACRACNRRKAARTPSAAQMPLLPPVQRLPGVDDPWDQLDVLDASLIATTEPTKQLDHSSTGGNPGSGRDGSGRAGTGSAKARPLPESNPYLRSGSVLPAADPVLDAPGLPPPAPPDPVPDPPAPPARQQRPQQQRRQRPRKGRRR